jgi:23S rRNA pseudouridine2605 synthase
VAEERIQKIIADSGYCSRRAAEKYIEAGAVKVGGHTAHIGDKAQPGALITVNGERIGAVKAKKRYIKLYKPRGYVTSMKDADRSKHIITELLSKIPERVYPVGRLDKVSEGLLILTNDGDFANKITHPTRNIAKKYRVTIPASVAEEKIAQMSAGINIGKDGQTERTAPCSINVLTESPDRTVLEFVITEGKNRQIRRMCEAVGLTVSRLKRTSVGGVKLGMLAPGEFADLTKEELALLGLVKGKTRP